MATSPDVLRVALAPRSPVEGTELLLAARPDPHAFIVDRYRLKARLDAGRNIPHLVAA